jgi:hypothetical protein
VENTGAGVRPNDDRALLATVTCVFDFFADKIRFESQIGGGPKEYRFIGTTDSSLLWESDKQWRQRGENANLPQNTRNFMWAFDPRCITFAPLNYQVEEPNPYLAYRHSKLPAENVVQVLEIDEELTELCWRFGEFGLSSFQQRAWPAGCMSCASDRSKEPRRPGVRTTSIWPASDYQD